MFANHPHDPYDPVRKAYRRYLRKLRNLGVVAMVLCISVLYRGVPHLKTATGPCCARYQSFFGSQVVQAGQYSPGLPTVLFIPLRDCLR